MRDGKNGTLQIELGRLTKEGTATIEQGSIKPFVLSVLLISILVVCPKIVFYSWTIAMFRWWTVPYFLIMMLMIVIVKASANAKEQELSTRLKNSTASAFISTLGVEKSPSSSLIMLSFSAIYAIIVLCCAMPYGGSEVALYFNISSPSTFYLTDFEDQQKICICQNASSEVSGLVDQDFEGSGTQTTTQPYTEPDTTLIPPFDTPPLHTVLNAWQNQTIFQRWNYM